MTSLAAFVRHIYLLTILAPAKINQHKTCQRKNGSEFGLEQSRGRLKWHVAKRVSETG
jgi:hypothetical protein